MYVDGPTKTVLLRVKDPFYIRDLLPKSRTVAHEHFNVAIKHTLGSTKILRNLGIEVPAPIQTQYDWPGKYTPFDHQRVMAEFLTFNRKCFNLSEMGVGKSAAALWAADFLMKAGVVRKVLILSPLSTLERVWKNDIFDVLMHRSAVKLYGSRTQRLEALEYDVDFYIMNHDGVKIGPVHEALKKRKDIDLIIVDEASVFRNHQTQMYKGLYSLVRDDQRLWLLTGTPTPNAPTDAWALARLISKSNVPKFFGQFKRETMNHITTFKWAPKPDAEDTVYKALQPAIRFKKADCLTLPPLVTTERQTTLTKEQADAFKSMMTTLRMEANGEQIGAVNAADKITKLRQILCGVVKDPSTDRYVEIDHSTRTKTLLETMQEASAKILVIVPFKGIIQTLEKEVGKHYSVAVVNGDVSPKKRDETFLKFKTEKDPHVLLCHPAVMSHGLNLTEADMLIFYAPIYSNDQFLQVVERFNRTGQTRKMTVVRLGAHPVEWDIYRAVDVKSKSQKSLLDLYRSIITMGD